MKEIALAQQLHSEGVLSEAWYYMGFYVSGILFPCLNHC